MQTHRHLVLATDCWLCLMVKGIARPYHPWGLGGSWLTNPRRWGVPDLRYIVNFADQHASSQEATPTDIDG